VTKKSFDQTAILPIPKLQNQIAREQNMSSHKILSFLLLFVILCVSTIIKADGHGDSFIEKAVASTTRTDEEKARDLSRKPAETLEFFGIEEDMRVLELMPGGGWYTKILNEIVKDKGQLYIALGTQRLDFEDAAFEKVKITGTGYGFERTDAPGFVANLTPGDFEVKDLDMVLTFRNAHNLTTETRAQLNSDIFSALAPGGIYGVIDHTLRHMEPRSAVTWRRTDPVQIIKEALGAGFVFEAYSDVHYRSNDGLEFDSRHETIKGNSDRYTLKFRKPK